MGGTADGAAGTGDCVRGDSGTAQGTRGDDFGGERNRVVGEFGGGSGDSGGDMFCDL